MQCYWCGRVFPDDGNRFSLHGHEFCGDRCLEDYKASLEPPPTNCAYCGQPVGTAGREAPDGAMVCSLKCYNDYLPEAQKRAEEQRRAAAEASERAILEWADYIRSVLETPLLAVKCTLPANWAQDACFSMRITEIEEPGAGDLGLMEEPLNWSDPPSPIERFASWLEDKGIDLGRNSPAGTVLSGGEERTVFLYSLVLPSVCEYQVESAKYISAWLERNRRDLCIAYCMDTRSEFVRSGWLDEAVTWDRIRNAYRQKTGTDLPETGWTPPNPKDAISAAKAAADAAGKATLEARRRQRDPHSSSVPQPVQTPVLKQQPAQTPVAAARPPDPPAAPVESGGLWARPGLSSEIALKGCSWASKGGWATIEAKAAAVENRSPWDTGSLKFVFWLCRGPAGENGLDGAVQMGEAWASKPPLGRGAKLAGVSVSMRRTGNPPTGDYRAVLTVNERNADGRNYIVGWCNFPKLVHWTHR